MTVSSSSSVVPSNLNYLVGCTITEPMGKLRNATPEEFGDALMLIRDRWEITNAVEGMRKTYVSSEEVNPTMGSVSAFTTETCPVCKGVYSGADIIGHYRNNHSLNARQNSHMMSLLEKAQTDCDLRQAAQRIDLCYSTESEGMSDTTELSDSHVREAGKHLSVDVLVQPSKVCKEAGCMTNHIDNVLVTRKWVDGGSSYKCVHGTHWLETWEASYSHARWDHLRDAHMSEQSFNDNAGLAGQNPLYQYLWRQKHTRMTRVNTLVSWVKKAHLKDILRAMNGHVLSTRRKVTVAQAVGFETTPQGKWDGVGFNDDNGFVRETKVNVVNPQTGEAVEATMTRLANWSNLYLTKEDMGYIETCMKQRVGK